jgi:hypothetical protein
MSSNAYARLPTHSDEGYVPELLLTKSVTATDVLGPYFIGFAIGTMGWAQVGSFLLDSMDP